MFIEKRVFKNVFAKLFKAELSNIFCNIRYVHRVTTLYLAFKILPTASVYILVFLVK